MENKNVAQSLSQIPKNNKTLIFQRQVSEFFMFVFDCSFKKSKGL